MPIWSTPCVRVAISGAFSSAAWSETRPLRIESTTREAAGHGSFLASFITSIGAPARSMSCAALRPQCAGTSSAYKGQGHSPSSPRPSNPYLYSSTMLCSVLALLAVAAGAAAAPPPPPAKGCPAGSYGLGQAYYCPSGNCTTCPRTYSRYAWKLCRPDQLCLHSGSTILRGHRPHIDDIRAWLVHANRAQRRSRRRRLLQ
jgi:hypothetical protein